MKQFVFAFKWHLNKNKTLSKIEKKQGLKIFSSVQTAFSRRETGEV